MRPLERANRLARRQHGAISSAQLRACGLTRDQIRHHVRSGRLTVARRGVYVVAGAPDSWELRASTKLLAHGDGAALSHRAAGWLQGLIDERPERIDVVVPHGSRNGSQGPSVHRVKRLDAQDARRVLGLRVTTPPRTLVDLAGVLTDRALARAVDRALLAGTTTIAVLRRYILNRGLQRNTGVGRLVKLLDDREFGVPESELERRMLELIAAYRLPEPRRQTCVGTHRVDLTYDTTRLVIEVDGRATHGTAEAFEADPVRQNALVLDGWTVLRFTWRQVTQDPDHVAGTIRRALE